MKRLKAVVVKEFAHILRDPTSLTIVFLMPVLMMFIFGYSINFDLDRVETGIIDLSDSEMSRNLVKKFVNNRYFVVEDLEETYADPLSAGERLLKSGHLNRYYHRRQRFQHRQPGLPVQ